MKLDNHTWIKKSWNSKHRTRGGITAVFVFLIFFTLLLQGPTFAVEDETLDEIINSFDDKKSGVSADTMQGVLEGFDDESKDAGKITTEDDILEGFDDDTQEAEPESLKDEIKPSVFSLSGDIQLGTSYNYAHHKPEEGETDWRGLSRLRTELNLELNAKFSSSWQARISGKGAYDFAYAIKGRNEFTDDVLDNCEKEFELGETYIQGSLTSRLDIKFGRQVVVWGKSDNIRVTDVLNPLDMREPGITDIEDLRLPLTM
ncbi:MAG: DUF1302 family protein, partial [Deltaproteobacteria bacterium]|nr:DUF1302 family protein [Deltaproteobacteria bacterium]